MFISSWSRLGFFRSDDVNLEIADGVDLKCFATSASRSFSMKTFQAISTF
jgi:hypothetical protein